MTVTDDRRDAHPLGVQPGGGPGTARAAINQMIEAGLLDDVMARADAGELRLTGEGGFLPEMIKAVLERGLAAELTGHLGYEKGDTAGRGSPNSRNGSSPRSVTWPCPCRGTGPAASSRGWSRRAPAGPVAWTT